jgi:hypothetical protein
VHSIALQVPIKELTNGYTGGDPKSARAVIGVWTTASRRKSRVFDDRRDQFIGTGPWVQVSRLGNPLINEVIIPMGLKDRWNNSSPLADKDYLRYYARPELAKLLPVLYPGVFPKLAELNARKEGGDRADLIATLLTGIPNGVVAEGFNTFTGTTPMDKVRLNTAIPPTATPNKMGALGGDVAGFPNGRRLTDDVVAIELQAVAGALFKVIDKDYTPDDAATAINDGTSGPAPISKFPYAPVPLSGFDVPAA